MSLELVELFKAVQSGKRIAILMYKDERGEILSSAHMTEDEATKAAAQIPGAYVITWSAPEAS